MASRVFSEIKGNFVAGLLLVLPLIITVVFLRFLFGMISDLFSPFLVHFFPHIPSWLIRVMSIAVLIVLVFWFGTLTKHFLGRFFWTRFENILMQIPLLRTVYSSSREVVGVFRGSNRDNLKELVLIEYPRVGMKAFGFVTGSVIDDKGVDCFKIFVPTTPNPTSGFLEIVEKSQVVRCNLSIEDGIKMIMSGGILGPENLAQITIPADSPQTSAPEPENPKI